MISVLDEIGYNVVSIKVLKAMHYNVPQKRERIFIVDTRKDINVKYEYPAPSNRVYILKDALKKVPLCETDVPHSEGAKYLEHKKQVLDLVPPMRYWRNLPLDIQKQYMGKSFYLGGGKLAYLEGLAGMNLV